MMVPHLIIQESETKRKPGAGTASDDTSPSNIASGIGLIAALICFPLGSENSGWLGGLIAAVTRCLAGC